MAPPRMPSEQMLQAIRCFVKEEGRLPKRLDFERKGNCLPSRQAIERAFRIWQRAVEIAMRDQQNHCLDEK